MAMSRRWSTSKLATYRVRLTLPFVTFAQTASGEPA